MKNLLLPDGPVNVGETERLAAGVLAGVLLARSLRRPAPLPLVVAGCLLYRAFSGHCYGYQWLGASTCRA